MSSLERGVTFILGGARSGKSSFAEGLIEASSMDAVFLATGRAWDNEMSERIELHKARRGPNWTTIEEPLDLVGALEKVCTANSAILVDCLTLWLTNLMMGERDIEEETATFVTAISHLKGAVVLVSNEVGLGIVPENRMARAFRDHAGRLHQAVAQAATTVYFVAAGLPLKMKG
ncbi:bifunctional adenosylcobinamide kinase/adenosylcobinamide-phosphate guanylyltransferase [Phyllobacterium brassicacearum]|uniref:Bifunctional adenosylcobalamin biosynthesis protein n=1 Tax=Phyllobacterium brassicacearum TaxID=314235 RepID=A0A2P7BTK1_9HYPH|nr:bifunctional adenosylcobinamide kinase/adenosylcobinamide-phosphate guanylyltransferase [Phyllobacterium brassicacearum]PSH69813.1 bifunctional adenosylcobinamide kinase/adenosylcobinamide-phosphate guanylyltransferase [Phyllobacterium brassicacearum]TDQ34973.1 adenosylcobinamide kinase /adenosylcobinamide-phosphate guanylyltransferase [Phyllobacterium brassicacearum]